MSFNILSTLLFVCLFYVDRWDGNKKKMENFGYKRTNFVD